MKPRIKRRPSVFSPRKLRALRLKRASSVEDAAWLCSQATGQKISSRAFRYWESGQSVPGSERLSALADWLRVPLAALFEDRVSGRATLTRIGVGRQSEASGGTVPEPPQTSKRQS
jgi:transcriptional regulator with XRE-family HTH domain